MIGRRNKGELLFDIFNVLFLISLGLVTLYPFVYNLSISLSTPGEANQLGLHIFPHQPTLDSYGKVARSPDILLYYWNTIKLTVIGTIVNIALLSSVAYPLSRRTFPHRKFLTFLLVFSMLFSGGLIPTYLIVKNLHLLNTIWALILPVAVSAFNVIILRNFYQSIPQELIDSAKVDGASELRILVRIVMPLSVPALAVIALWSAVGYWNTWFSALIYIKDASKQVLQVFLRQTVITQDNSFIGNMLSTQHQIVVTPETLKAATILFVMFPILLMYPFVQRYFVKGVMLGSIKG